MQQFNTWVRPLQVVERDGEIRLLAPNRYVVEWLGDNSLPRIKELIREFADGATPDVVLDVGTRAGAISRGARTGRWRVGPAALRALVAGQDTPQRADRDRRPHRA